MVQEVEVADIPCQYAGTDTPRLEIDERIVEVFPLMIGLDQRRPIDLLATPAGIELVEQYLTRRAYGVYA